MIGSALDSCNSTPGSSHFRWGMPHTTGLTSINAARPEVASMIIVGKSLGSRKKLFEDWSIPLPPELSEAGGVTLRRLIDAIVRGETAAFRLRQQDRRFVCALTSHQIAEGAEAGRISMGKSDVPIQAVDADAAVAAAWTAFEDGLYLVSIDGEEQKSLDQQIYVHEDSRLVFIRLTLLSGG